MGCNGTILLISKEAKTALQCQKALPDYTVVVCSSTADMERQWEKVAPSTVILDLSSPPEQVDQALKRKYHGSTIPGIILAKHEGSELIARYVNLGFSRILRTSKINKKLKALVAELASFTVDRLEFSRMKTILPLYTFHARFLEAPDEQTLYQDLVDVVSEIVEVSTVSLMIFDEDERCLRIVASKGIDPVTVSKIVLRPGERIAGKVFESREPVILNRATQHLSPFVNLLKRKDITAAVCFPLVGRSRKCLGVLNISETTHGREFTETELETLSILCDQVILAVENLKFIREREEQSRVLAQMEQFVSPQLSQILYQNYLDLKSIGEVRNLTVLFADIRNFTHLVQHLPSGDIRGFLNQFYEIFSSAVFACEGMIDKFIGDGALAVFGAPVAIKRPEHSGVSAARDIMVRFCELKEHWVAKDVAFQKIDLGIGVSSGRMFLGNIGSSERLDYTVLGKDVNVAQRLAAETGGGRVMLTAQVANSVTGNFELTGPEQVRLRGIEGTNSIYCLICENGAQSTNKKQER